MKIAKTMKPAAMAPALALAAGLLLAGGPADAAKPTCEDWADAPARTYCPAAEVVTQGDTCSVGGSCSVTFTYGPGGANSATLTPSLSISVSVQSVDDIDICIAPPTAASPDDSTYTAEIRTSCESGEVTAAEAAGGGFNN